MDRPALRVFPATPAGIRDLVLSSKNALDRTDLVRHIRSLASPHEREMLRALDQAQSEWRDPMAEALGRGASSP